MITIPTGDFVGILSDAIPFASPDDEFPTLHSIRLEWSGNALHALRALYTALGVDQPHHLTVRADVWSLTYGCVEGRCGISIAVRRAPLLSSPHAYGHTYEVWLDPDGALRFREIQ